MDAVDMVTPLKTIVPSTPVAPNLPIAPVSYAQQYQDQFNNALRLYFNQLDNLNGVTAQRVNSAGVDFPDGTEQTTAYVAGNIEVYDLSSSITVNSTPTLLTPASTNYSENISYNASTGVFTWEYSGGFALSLVVNALASASGQILYIYAQSNTGSGWTNVANSGKAYALVNGQTTQIVYSQAVVRTVGQQIRYYIYASDGHTTLVTSTLPGVTPTVYTPAIRIQYA
jgi:predicted heme/steroid binding protein